MKEINTMYIIINHRLKRVGSLCAKAKANVLGGTSPSVHKVRAFGASKRSAYPAVHLLKHCVTTLVKHPFKEHCSNYDGHGKRRRPPEEEIVDRLWERHVEDAVRSSGSTEFFRFRLNFSAGQVHLRNHVDDEQIITNIRGQQFYPRYFVCFLHF